MTDELKPDNCLLCGGECYFQMLPDAHANPIPAIICKKCGIRVYFYDESLDTHGVIAAWNARHNEPDTLPEWLGIMLHNKLLEQTHTPVHSYSSGFYTALAWVLSLRKPEDATK